MEGEAVSVLHERHGRIELEWKIQKFLNFPKPPGTHLQSSTFLLGDATFCFGIYPKGHRIEIVDDWIALFLSRISRSGEHSVSFSFRIEPHDLLLKDEEYKFTFNVDKKSWWNGQFFRRSTLLEKCKNDSTLSIICKARLMEGGHFRLDGVENLSKNYEQLFLSCHETDIKLKVQKKEFYAHKLVLGVRSPVFRAMFQHKMTESNIGVVEISDFDPELFDHFLFFVYTGKFDHVTPTNALGLYKAADKYDLKDLKSECSIQMVSGLNADIVLDVIALAVTHEETKLLETATEYFIKNAEDIFVTDKWKRFLSENTEFANVLLVEMAKRCKAAFET